MENKNSETTEIEANKKTKNVKKEISFKNFIKDKKSKLDELKNFFENTKNNQNDDTNLRDIFSYDTKEEFDDIIKKVNSIFVSNKRIIIPFNYKKTIYNFTITELIRFNEKDPYIKTLNLENLKNTFPPNINNFETVLKLAEFFSNKKTDEETTEELIVNDKNTFLEILKLYVNTLVDSVNWIKVDSIIKLTESIQNLKPKKFNDKKLVSNSLFFINKLDYIFSFREFFQPLKEEVNRLRSTNIYYEQTIDNLKRLIADRNDELNQIKEKKSELEKEIIEAQHNLQSLNIKSDSKQASSWQQKNEIIGEVQTNLSSFLNYELNIANEAVLDGEQGALKASKMINKLIIKIKEQKEWLSSLD